MSGLAAYYMSKGALVMGYDKTPSPITQDLAMKGAVITYDAAVEALPPAVKNPNTIVVVTAAIPFHILRLLTFWSVETKSSSEPLF